MKKGLTKQEMVASSFVNKSLVVTHARPADKIPALTPAKRKVSTEEALDHKKHSARDAMPLLDSRMVGCPHCRKLFYVEDPPTLLPPPQTTTAWVQTNYEETAARIISQLELKLEDICQAILAEEKKARAAELTLSERAKAASECKLQLLSFRDRVSERGREAAHRQRDYEALLQRSLLDGIDSARKEPSWVRVLRTGEQG